MPNFVAKLKKLEKKIRKSHST